MDFSARRGNMDLDTMSTTSSITSDAAEELGGAFGACRSLLAVSRILGVLPAEAARVKQVVQEPSQPYRPMRGTRIYSAVLYLVALGLGGMGVYYRSLAMMEILENARAAGEGTADNLRLYFRIAYVLFTVFFCLMYALFNRLAGNSFAEIFTALDSVDESFRFTDHNPAKKRAIKHLLFASLALPLAASDAYTLSAEFRETSAPIWAYSGLFLHFLVLAANVIVEQQFMAICLALRERFDHLNLHLISLQPLVFPIEDTELKFKHTDMSLNDHFYAIARSEFADIAKYNKQEHSILRARGVSPLTFVKPAWGADTTGSPITPHGAPSRLRPMVTETEAMTLKLRINLLRRIHDNLCDLMSQVNVLYGACLLASITFIFCGVLSLSYHVVTKALYPQSEGGPEVVVDLVQAIVWLLYLSARLIALTWACAETAKEAQRAGPLHQKLTKRTLDSSTKEELHLFSTQLLQRDIGFSVCGLFALDFTLLYTVAGAVTTYLVILIQFQSVQTPKASSPAGSNSTTTTTPATITGKPKT